MSTNLDAQGQPLVSDYNYSSRVNRGIHELIGFLRGIVADNHINEKESDALGMWLVANRELAEHWPVRTLAQRIERIYADGHADEEERAELAELVRDIVGRQDDVTLMMSPTDLPLTRPVPDVIFDSNEFVLTGRFLYGPRKACQREIELRGGRCSDTVRLQTSYLVVGSLTSRDWKYSSFGNKILKAAEYAERCPIAIVSEKHWESFLMDGREK